MRQRGESFAVASVKLEVSGLRWSLTVFRKPQSLTPSKEEKMKLVSKLGSIVLVAVLPVTLAAPASAVDYDRLNITVDCVIGETGGDDHVLRDGDVLTLTFTNCDGLTIQDKDDTGNATMPDDTEIDASDTQLVSGDSFEVTVVGEADLEVDGDEDVDVYVAGSIDDPASTLLATKKVTIGLSALETMIREEMIGDDVADDGNGDIYLDGDSACELEPGLHVYKTLEFEVTESGLYDFRAIAVSPIDGDLNWGLDEYPSSDPFLALYETFNPELPETGLVGCNDDGDDTGVVEIDDAWTYGDDNSYEGVTTDSEKLLDEQWPWFRVTLDPGNYTLVYMPYVTMGTEDFAEGRYGPTSNYNPTDRPELVWDPVAQSVTYEMWGPEGAITIAGSGGDEPLAPTGGVEPAFALWAGLGVIGVGVAMAVARRRELRV